MLSESHGLASDVALMQLSDMGRRARVADGVSKRIKFGVAERMKKLEEKGVTQAAIVARTGIDKSVISRLFSAKHVPDGSTAERICNAFHLRRDWFWAGEGAIFDNGSNEPSPAWPGFEGDRRLKVDRTLRLVTQPAAPEESAQPTADAPIAAPDTSTAAYLTKMFDTREVPPVPVAPKSNARPSEPRGPSKR